MELNGLTILKQWTQSCISAGRIQRITKDGQWLMDSAHMADILCGKKNEGLLEVMIDDEVIGHLNAEKAYMLVEAIEGSERANNGKKIFK